MKKCKTRNEMCDINLFRSYYIISARSMCSFSLKCPNSASDFNTMLLCEMCLSISVWMPTQICLYTYYYIPLLNEQPFHHWQKLCKSNWRAKSVSTSNMCHRVHPITRVQQLPDIHWQDKTRQDFIYTTSDTQVYRRT